MSRTGASIDALQQDLKRLLTDLGNITAYGPETTALRDAYLRWVEDVERSLGHRVRDDWVRALHTERYWKIREMDRATPRPWPLIEAEVAHQRARLDALSRSVTTEVGAAAPADPGETVIVADTNVYLHFPPFDQIDWHAVVDADRLLLGVPLIVMRELDDHKNRGGALAKRARTAVGALFDRLDGARTSPVAVSDRLRLCLLADLPDLERTTNNDDAILDRVRAHVDAGGQPVVVVTGDKSMVLRAQSRGLGAAQLPEDLRLPPPDELERRLRQVEGELRLERSKSPELMLTFAGGTSYFDPPPLKAASLMDVDAEVARAEDMAPYFDLRTYGMGRSLVAQEAERYNAEREEYIADHREWAEKANAASELRAGSVILDLVVTNAGAATAEDVEVRLALRTPTLRFATATDFEVGDPPEPPRQPHDMSTAVDRLMRARLSARDIVSREPSGWEVDENGLTAVLAFRQVRHGGAPVHVGGLFVISDTAPVTVGVHLEWTVTGVRPPISSRGTLDIRPRRGESM